jgi:hypothetical protein
MSDDDEDYDDDHFFNKMVDDREDLVTALIDNDERSELLLNDLVTRFEMSNTQALAVHQRKYNFEVEVIAELLYPMEEFRNLDLDGCAQHLRTLMARSSAFMEIVNIAKLSLQNKDDVAATKPKYFLDFIMKL